MKIDKDKLYKLDAIEIYKMILEGKLNQFPKGFWMRPEAPQNAIKCTKYMIENILHWNKDDIKQNLNQKIFIDNKLNGMLNLIYNSSSYSALDIAYPNKFKPWKLKMSPMNYWNKKTAKVAVKWLIEEKLQWNDTDIRNNLTVLIFKNNNLFNMLRKFYNNNIYNAINDLYPNKFKKEDLNGYNNNFHINKFNLSYDQFKSFFFWIYTWRLKYIKTK